MLRRGLLLILLVSAGLAAAPREMEVSARRADELLAKLPTADPWVAFPDGSSLAWGESHLLHALVDLYEATGDTKYLDEVARRGDRLLAHRDDRRGVKDGSGHSRPAWSMASKYVVAEGNLLDTTGDVVIALRSTASAYNNLTRVKVVSAEGKPDRFSLLLSNAQFHREEEFSDLSLDVADARFVEKVVNAPVPSHGAKAGKVTDHSSSLSDLGSPIWGKRMLAERNRQAAK